MQYQDKHNIFTQINQIIKTRKLVIFLCVISVLVPVVYYNETSIPTFEASVSLVFEDIASPTPDLMADASTELILNRIEEIKSRSFAEDIADALPMESVDGFLFPEELDQEIEKLKYLKSEIHKNINAFLLRNSNIIVITIQMQDPKLCMDIANTAAQVLKERNYQVRKTGLSSIRQFIGGQLDIIKDKLDLSEKSLREFKEQNRIMSFEMESEEIQKKMTQAEILFNVAISDKEAVKERLATIKRKFDIQKQEFVPSITMTSTPRVQKLKEKLIEMELQFVELRVQNYAAKHPKMVQLSHDIEKTRESLRKEAFILVNEDKLIDPITQMEKYANESLTLEIQLESLKAQGSALKSIIENYDQSLLTLPGKEYELVRLTRAREVNHKIYMMLSEKLEEAKISEAKNITEIRIIDEAELPKFPILPTKKLNIAIGLILGLIVGVGVAFMLEYKQLMVVSPEEVERDVNWPLLGIIPNIDMASNGKSKLLRRVNPDFPKDPFAKRGLISSLEPKSGAADAYRMLRTNLLFKGVKNQYKTLLVTSIGPSNGKSTTAANLAISFAALGNKTLLVDADFRMSSLHSVFGFDREPGLGDLLENANLLREKLSSLLKQNVFAEFDTEQTRYTSLRDHFIQNDMEDEYNVVVEKWAKLQIINKNAIRKTNIDNLSFISSGKKLNEPSENVSTRSIKLILEELKNKFDIIIIDSPPITLVPETSLLSNIVDGIFFVVDSNQYDREMLIRAKNISQNANASVIGVVVNNIKNKQAYNKYHYYYGTQSA